MTHNPVTDQ